MISHLDHLVLTVADPAATVDFYVRVLGMDPMTFGQGRLALHFGRQKINLHQAGAEVPPVAARPVAGSADLCFITRVPIARFCRHLWSEGVEIVEGPVRRTGATGPIISVYLRDLDGNLIEVANELEPQT